MKEPAPSEARKGLSKEKKQLLMLGALSAVLLAVLAVPFGAAEDEPEPEPEPEIAAAESAAEPTTGAPSAAPATPAPASADAAGPTGNAVLASDEPVEEDGLMRSPFESFWALTKPVETKVDDLPPPVVTLNGTLTSGRTPAAVIDGQTRFIGDMIQGWALEAIGSREVTLRSPGKNRVTIQMPLLQVRDKRPPTQKQQQAPAAQQPQ